MIRKNKVLLNTWGVFIYFFCQWLLTILVTRIRGYEEAGILTLTISFSNIFSFIAMFSVRGIHVSDVNEKYSDSDFYTVRIITCLIAMLCFMMALPFFHNDREIVICSIAMMIFKIFEAGADFTIGCFQRKERFLEVAIAYTLRGILPLLFFIGSIFAGLSLSTAVFVMAFAFLVCLLLYDLREVQKREKIKFAFDRIKDKEILKNSFPLMMTSLIDAGTVFIPRYEVEKILGSAALGYYNAISIIVVALSTLATAVWGAILPRISRMILFGKWREFKKQNNLIICMILAGGASFLGLANLAGPFVFQMIYGESIIPYLYLITPVMLNALLLLFNSYYNCIFIPMEKRTILLYSNIAAIVCSFVAVRLLISTGGIKGACYGLTIGLLTRSIILFINYLIYIRKKQSAED